MAKEARMPAGIKRVLSEDKVEMKINLEEIFGTAPKNQALRQAIGQALIDKLISRTEQGRSFAGTKFKAYSKAYKESLEFKAFGKTDNVNLKLTGDMLGLLDIKDESGNTITLGWDDNEQNAKAYNHITGDTVPVRDFFGFSQSEIKEIVSEFKENVTDFNEKSFDEAAIKLLEKVLENGES